MNAYFTPDYEQPDLPGELEDLIELNDLLDEAECTCSLCTSQDAA